MTRLLNNPKSSEIEVLRYTVFWLNWFLKDEAPSPEIVGIRAKSSELEVFKVYHISAEMVCT